jgi:hypothetical protein
VATNDQVLRLRATMDETRESTSCDLQDPPEASERRSRASGTATKAPVRTYTVDTTNFTMNGTTTSAVVPVTIYDDEEAKR